jgi:hypothetical protein
MITTANDLTRLVDAIRTASLLSPASTTAMLTVQGTDPADPDQQYGYGMFLRVSGGRLVGFGHGGADPGINATVRHYIDHHATIVVLANVDEEGAELTAAEVADLIVSSLELGD